MHRVEKVKRKRGRPKKKTDIIPNICHRCVYHFECIPFRYNGIKTKYVEKFKIEKLYDGKKVLYIEKCSKYESYDFREEYNKY